jgi:uncharacterized membrane protein
VTAAVAETTQPRASAQRVSPWFVAVCTASLLYTVVLTIESVWRHDHFLTTFDLGVYDQAVWLLASGHDPFLSIVQSPLLGDHFQPGVALLVPLYWLGLGTTGLLLAQSLALAATAPALYWLGRDVGARPALAFVPAVLWLTSPFVAAVNLAGFHPTVFVPALLVAAVVLARQRRYWLLAFVVLVGLSFKEDTALVWAALGLVLAIRGRRWAGRMIALASAAWFVIAVRIVESQSDAYDFQGKRFAGDRGDTVGEAIQWMLGHPGQALWDAVSDGQVGTVIIAVLMTGGLCLIAPLWLLPALPIVAHNVLSANRPQHAFLEQYWLLPATCAFLAAAMALPRLQKHIDVRPRPFALGAAMTVAMLTALVGHARVHEYRYATPGDRPSVAEIRSVLDRIPPNAPVAASASLLPQLAQRTDIYALPEPFIHLKWGGTLSAAERSRRADRVRYVVFYTWNLPHRFAPTHYNLPARLRTGGFVEVVRSKSLRLYERASTTGA